MMYNHDEGEFTPPDYKSFEPQPEPMSEADKALLKLTWISSYFVWLGTSGYLLYQISPEPTLIQCHWLMASSGCVAVFLLAFMIIISCLWKFAITRWLMLILVVVVLIAASIAWWVILGLVAMSVVGAASQALNSKKS